jgi:hypothetical protein
MKICEDASDPSLRVHPLVSLANCEQPGLDAVITSTRNMQGGCTAATCVTSRFVDESLSL